MTRRKRIAGAMAILLEFDVLFHHVKKVAAACFMGIILSSAVNPINSFAVENGTLALGDTKVVAPQLSGDRRPYCSAALLSEYIVVSAAHCFTQNTGNEDSPVRSDAFTVSLPGVDVNIDDLSSRVKVMKIVVVPGYDNIWKPEKNDVRTQKDDIAFLFLEKPLVANYQIDVATQFEVNELKNSKSLITHYGYGLQSKDKTDGKPYKINLNATTKSGNPTVDFDKIISTEEIGGALCGGDSGGPSYAVINGVTKLVGDTVGAGGCQGTPISGRGIDLHTLTAPFLPMAKTEWEKYALENKITYSPIRAFEAIELGKTQLSAAANAKAKQDADAKAKQDADAKAKQEADAKASVPVVSTKKITSGTTCKVLNQKVTYLKKTYTCIKVSKKLVWDKGVMIVAAVPKPSPTPNETKKASYNSLWEKYRWTKPTTAIGVANAATKAFSDYIKVERSPAQVVIVKTQEGVDAFWANLLTTGMSLVAKSFAYPSFNQPVYAVAGLDADWMVKTFVSLGFTSDFAEKRGRDGFDGVVANAGGNTAIWNIANINKKNLLQTDKVGMYQTAGHEFFHPIQQKLTNGGQKFPPNGTGGPTWFLEGTAVFVGIQTVNKLEQLSYEREGRPYLVRNVLNDPTTKSGKLEDAKYNLQRQGDVFPYNIGALGTELLVANVGIQKMLDVFSEMGKGKDFATAFKDATGVVLADFYTMFEESRSELGIPRT